MGKKSQQSNNNSTSQVVGNQIRKNGSIGLAKSSKNIKRSQKEHSNNVLNGKKIEVSQKIQTDQSNSDLREPTLKSVRKIKNLTKQSNNSEHDVKASDSGILLKKHVAKNHSIKNSLNVTSPNSSQCKKGTSLTEKGHRKRSKIVEFSDETTDSQQKKNEKIKLIEADQHVETSESDSDTELHEDSVQKINASDRSKNEEFNNQNSTIEKKSTRIKGPEYSVFVGNLPTTIKKSSVKALFKQYGEILTIRFRTSDGVSLFKKKDRREAKALICYVRFATKEAAQSACVVNGQTVEQNRIRVSLHNQKHMGHTASTVFVGNIHRNTTDNELYDFFSRVGEIEYVRQIGDKGIGFVCFKKGIPIAKALKLNQQLLNGRPLRISKVDPSLQSARRNKKGNLVKLSLGSPSNASKHNHYDNPKATNNVSQPRATEVFHGAIARKKTEKRNIRNRRNKGEFKKKVLAKKLIAANVRKLS